MFAARPEHTLVEHEWLSTEDFKNLLTDTIDIGMQVSFSETFNMVSADCISCGVPIVVSDEIDWASSVAQVRSSTSVTEIVSRMSKVYKFRRSVICDSIDNLIAHTRRAKSIITDQLEAIL